MRRVFLGLFAAAALAPLSAAAQSPPAAPAQAPARTTPPAKARPAARTVEGITVEGQGTQAQLSIDRKSYDISKDLQTTTGSIADALRNVPAVDVDLNGNVSLRGDPNVTVMIDGRPSNMFKGPNAGQALQSLPADQIERVEVITNPTAAYSPEGTAGIINLVTKKGRGAGFSGSARASLGGAGRKNAGVSVAYNAARLTLTGDLSWRFDPQHAVGDTISTAIDPATGAAVTTDNHNDLRGPMQNGVARGGVDFDLTDATRLSADLRQAEGQFHPDSLSTVKVFGPTGALVGAFDQLDLQHGQDVRDTSGHLGLRHKFSGDEHLLTLDFDRERTHQDIDTAETQSFELPAAPDRFRELDFHTLSNHMELKADYSRPLPAEAKLKAGYDLHTDRNSYLNTATLGASQADAQPDPGETNLFRYYRAINALYGTYEQPFGDWTMLAGLRLEEVQLKLDDPTTGFRSSRDEFDAYPTLHLGYRLSDAQQLSLSYSHRVQRPATADLNPFRYVAALAARQGNPDLRNQDTHSFEAGWQYKRGGTFYLATLFYRLNEHGVTDVITELPGAIELDTKANLARSQNAGLELVANSHLTKTLSYNLSANLYYNEIDAGGLDFQGKRSAFAVGGRASLNWQAAANDLFQVNVSQNPKRLLPQGFDKPMTLVFLGYRHKFDDRLSLVVTAQDPFDIYHFKRTIETPALKQVVTSRGRLQSAFVGLVWSFGAANKRPKTPDFDFGGGSN